VTFRARFETSDVVLDYSIGDKHSRNYIIVKIFFRLWLSTHMRIT